MQRLGIRAVAALVTCAGLAASWPGAAVAAPQDSAPPAAATPSLFSQATIDAELAAARSWLELSLVDYESARFMQVRLVLHSGDRRNRRNVTLVVCGLVNARNRMGGYTGYQPFYHGTGLPAWRLGTMGPAANEICGPANRLSTTDYSDWISSRSSAGASGQ